MVPWRIWPLIRRTAKRCICSPASASTTGIGVHYFFSAKEEVPPRKVLVPDRGLDDLVVFTSSEEGYYFFDSAHSTDSLHIMKARFDWSTGLFDTVWHQEGPVGTNASRVDASSDGDWLLFTTGTSMAAGRPANDGDRSLSVLDSATGEIVFFAADSQYGCTDAAACQRYCQISRWPMMSGGSTKRFLSVTIHSWCVGPD